MSKGVKTYIAAGVVIAIVVVIALKQSASTTADTDIARIDQPTTVEAVAPTPDSDADDAGPEQASAVESADSRQLPRFVEVGAESCIPCKMMKPVLEELEAAHAGALEIEFADVWKNPELADKYQVRSIPTQVIYDADGNEVYRHMGFWPRDEIERKLKELDILE